MSDPSRQTPASSRTSIAVLAATIVAIGCSASAQDRTGPQSETWTVNARVLSLCSVGETGSLRDTIDMGVLIDTDTGRLRRDLPEPERLIEGSWCNGPSTLTLSAAPMRAQNADGTPPAGFTEGVDFTATAIGWTADPAVYVTDGDASPEPTVQTLPMPQQAMVTVRLSEFTAEGGPDRLPVPDPLYLGSVILLLQPRF